MQWKILQSATKFHGFFKLVLYKLRFQSFSGNTIVVNREVFERGNAAAVLAYDPQQDLLLLVEQFRAGAINWRQPWLLELVAGIIEPRQTGAETIKREAAEEAGVKLNNIKCVYHYLVSPGASTEELELYVATFDSSQAAEYAGLASEGEDIKVHLIKREYMLQQLAANKIDNATTLIGMQWLAANYASWREQNFA